MSPIYFSDYDYNPVKLNHLSDEHAALFTKRKTKQDQIKENNQHSSFSSFSNRERTYSEEPRFSPSSLSYTRDDVLSLLFSDKEPSEDILLGPGGPNRPIRGPTPSRYIEEPRPSPSYEDTTVGHNR